VVTHYQLYSANNVVKLTGLRRYFFGGGRYAATKNNQLKSCNLPKRYVLESTNYIH
jgi:hypothetical protein